MNLEAAGQRSLSQEQNEVGPKFLKKKVVPASQMSSPQPSWADSQVSSPDSAAIQQQLEEKKQEVAEVKKTKKN